MDYYISVALIGISAALAAACCLPTLKILQLSGYRSRGVLGFWKATHCEGLVRYCALTMLGAIAVAIYVGCFGTFEYARYCAVATFSALEIVFIVAVKKNGDTDIKATPRMVRLIVLSAALILALSAGAAWAAYYDPFCQIVATAIGIFLPFVVMAANTLLLPFEKLNNGRFVKQAKKKLADKQPIVVCITGSFGKTTAKNILKAILEKKYSVCATPGNYNTPMGICKTVNGMLADEQVFIAELGARYKGDIAELCAIVEPHYGIITAVGDMHIATLGSREGVANVKFELAEHADADGLVALNGYNADCAELAARTAKCAIERTGDGTRVRYENLTYGAFGAKFTLYIDGQSVEVTTKLLGAHIPELVCVCAAIARELGVEIESIADAVSALEPVEHRLQLLQEHAGVSVIDDAYNSNPVGAKNALDVLGEFDGTRIIITPGFVELGAIEKQCNTVLGAQIAEKCDYAFLVGSRATDIKNGAISAGMAEEKIRVFDKRDDAVSALAELPNTENAERIVLFENDLPDNIK